MNVTVVPWEGSTVPTEDQIISLLDREGLRPYKWSNGPGDVYAAHSHTYHKVIYAVRGSIRFGLPDNGDHITLQAGDRLELPAGVRHDALVGPEGVVCLESHR